MPYSLQVVVWMGSDLFMYMAILPLLPFCLLASMMLYPVIFGEIAPGAIHVSYIQIMSMSSYAINWCSL
jgi:hypothetical protein